MTEPLFKCPKCGAVMVSQIYHEYGWYLQGQRVASWDAERVKVERGRI